MTTILAGFPPPPLRAIDLPGPFEIAMYAVCIVAGAVLAVLLATRLWRSRGGDPEDVLTATLWAVVLGIIGARIYHVISSPDGYFGEDGDFLRAFQIWHGGLSIIGAVAAGSIGVWLACRRYGMKFGAFADAVVPGVLLAQAVGRWGNWFNQELFGRSTDLPWGLRIDLDQAHSAPAGTTEQTLFHPTFLYESIWNLLGVVALVWLYRRFQFRSGLLTLTYVAYYALGRFWIESLRIDEETKSTQYPLREAIGLDWRLNQIIVFVVFLAAVAGMIYLWTKRPRTEDEILEQLEVYRPGAGPRGSQQSLDGDEDAEKDSNAEAGSTDEDSTDEDSTDEDTEKTDTSDDAEGTESDDLTSSSSQADAGAEESADDAEETDADTPEGAAEDDTEGKGKPA
ncbi:prolipoprotein diacylglyceryl transferase [Nesterenkonia alba]|uniref:prolipoprotein diacylglyceryl transferase n=1 Tax=Nesterenkonia alba TaxID=515814 RepID=UPI0003B6C482|nr:prolipoprotein diacylglyceryl transferase [Nesterenkonia alba]